MVTSLLSLYMVLAVALVPAGTSTNSGAAAATPAPIAANATPISLTLDQVVNIAVNNNTNVVLAKQRLSEAAEGINQVNALGRPQLSSVVADTYSTFAESSANYSAAVTNPTLPGGSTIPTVVDQAANFPTSFGLGTLSSSLGASGAGTISSLTGTSVSLPSLGGTTSTSPTTGSTTSTSLPGLSSGSGSGAGAPSTTGTTNSPGSTTTPSGTSTSGMTNGTGSSTGAGTAAATSGADFELAPMPSIIQSYVTETGVPSIIAASNLAADNVEPSASGKSADLDTPSGSTTNNTRGEAQRVPDQGTVTTAPVDGTQAVSNKDAVNNYGARISLSKYIDAFGLLRAEKSAEDLTTDFYAIDVARNENEVALSAKNLYFNVILAQQNVATEQQAVNDATESVRVTAALVQNGQAAGFDLLSAQTTLANDQQLLTAAQDNYSFAMADLDYLLGIDPGTPVTLTAPPLPALNQPVDLAQCTKVALQRRPEILQADRNIKLAQKLVKVASAGTTPTLGLVGEYGYNSTSSASGPTNEGLFSAQVAIPFDDGGATRSRVRQAKDVLQGQVITRNELQLNVQLEVRQAYLNILEGQSSAATAQSGVNLAEETLRVANVQYQNGVGTILDVENAQAQLATARTNLSNAQFTYETALASLVRAIGSR